MIPPRQPPGPSDPRGGHGLTYKDNLLPNGLYVSQVPGESCTANNGPAAVKGVPMGKTWPLDRFKIRGIKQWPSWDLSTFLKKWAWDFAWYIWILKVTLQKSLKCDLGTAMVFDPPIGTPSTPNVSSVTPNVSRQEWWGASGESDVANVYNVSLRTAEDRSPASMFTVYM